MDTWAAGCILYTLLGGYQPFYAPIVSDLINLIKDGGVAFHGPEWESVSEPAKDLIKLLLQPNPDSRATVHMALAHRWIVASKKTDKLQFPSRIGSRRVTCGGHMASARKASENVELFLRAELPLRRLAGRQSVLVDASQLDNLI